MHSVIAPASQQLREFFDGDYFPWFATAADRLACDLASTDGEPAPPSTRTPRVHEPAAAFGAAYVVLGSRLGGPFIARAVTTRLCLGPEHVTYLAPDTPVACEWRSYLSALETWHVAADGAARLRCVDTAHAMFDAVQAALLHEGVPPSRAATVRDARVPTV